MGASDSQRQDSVDVHGGIMPSLLAGAMGLVGIGWVQVKMLPFDNKNEFQVIINMPEGCSLEQTVQAAREIARPMSSEPEVVDYQIYAGTSAPFNFNGLGSPLFPAAWRACGRHTGQSAAKRRTLGAEPRYRQAGPSKS